MTTYTLNHTTTLTTMSCGVCGIAFAIPESLNDKALKDHTVWWYCPNGHHIHYLGKSEVEKAKERAERAERRAANAQEDARAAHASLVATKGDLTRVKKRAAHGVCPCCSRTFANVARHVAGQHPEFVEAQS